MITLLVALCASQLEKAKTYEINGFDLVGFHKIDWSVSSALANVHRRVEKNDQGAYDAAIASWKTTKYPAIEIRLMAEAALRTGNGYKFLRHIQSHGGVGPGEVDRASYLYACDLIFNGVGGLVAPAFTSSSEVSSQFPSIHRAEQFQPRSMHRDFWPVVVSLLARKDTVLGARNFARAALAIEPKFTAMRCYLAQELIDNEYYPHEYKMPNTPPDYAGAVREAKLAVQNDPKSSIATWTLAYSYYADRHANSRSWLKKYLTMDDIPRRKRNAKKLLEEIKNL